MNCANHSDREKVAFCQNCGKPLCQECTRAIGPAVYCEPCLAAKLAGAPGAYSYSDPVSGVNVSGTASGGTYTYVDPVTGAYAAGVIRPQQPRGTPNPVLAGFLGLIPGVGAMYNEQFAKAGVHLVVFVVLISFANSVDVFGIFVAGWIFYMAFEAFHTARCRRDGLPLPNPFGLNELGQKLGFDKSWGVGNHYPNANPAAAPTMPPDPYAVPPFAGSAAGPAAYAPPYASPNAVPYNPGAPGAHGSVPPNWGVPPAPEWNQYIAPPPPVPLDAQVPYPGNRFPAGALWLIGLGALFLATNAGVFHGFSGRLFLPFLFLGLAVFIFVRKLTGSGYSLAGDGSTDYRIRVFRALRGSVWLALVGLLFFLDEFHILTWGHSWPLFIILAGVMTVLQRSVCSPGAPLPPYAQGYEPGYGYAPQPTPQAPPAASTEIVPTAAHDGFTNDNDKEGS